MYIEYIGICIISGHQKEKNRCSCSLIFTLVHSCASILHNRIIIEHNKYILDSVGARIGFVKRSYKGGRMYTPLRIIKQCLPTITILNSLLLHHKITYVTLTVNVRILFFVFFLFSDSLLLVSYHEIDPRPSNFSASHFFSLLNDDDER
jgi:hypothetical protein